MLILDLIFLWVHGGGGGGCRRGDGSLMVVMGLLMGLSRWLGLLMGFGFNGFWDWWLWVSMGFVQRWGLAWVVLRSCVVVGVDRGEVVHGGSDGSDGVHAWWFQWDSDGDHCCELWLISGHVELWLNEHAY